PKPQNPKTPIKAGVGGRGNARLPHNSIMNDIDRKERISHITKEISTSPETGLLHGLIPTD
ncbi:MAG: hypothetical protein P4L50_29035, partial [Anaerolineaceae bacterium]|nr:hypothetical protein [Anaerolineaceae bacterium]